MLRDKQFIFDMLDSAELALGYLQKVSKQDFLTNTLIQDAIIRRLLVIAEAARRISEETKQNNPQISWVEIKGMRNRLVHEYDDIDLEIVWEALEKDIPNLIVQLQTLI